MYLSVHIPSNGGSVNLRLPVTSDIMRDMMKEKEWRWDPLAEDAFRNGESLKLKHRLNTVFKAGNVYTMSDFEDMIDSISSNFKTYHI